jgi:hypothetical protein
MSSNGQGPSLQAEDVTLEEMAIVEETLGVDLETLNKYRRAAAMIWILRRRDDPTFTYQDALQTTGPELARFTGEADGDDSGVPQLSSPESGT